MTPSLASCARWRDTVLLGCPVRAARVRTEGKHLPVRSANATRFCNVQCRCRRTVRYRSMVTGTKASMGPPGCSSTRPEAAGVGRTSPVYAKGLAKIGEVGKSLDCQIRDFGPGR